MEKDNAKLARLVAEERAAERRGKWLDALRLCHEIDAHRDHMAVWANLGRQPSKSQQRAMHEWTIPNKLTPVG